MTETMEQYMSKTRMDYGSGVARPKIDNKDQFELKRQFLKELRENTFSGSDNEDANEHIEKVLEIVDLFHVPNITVDQLMLRVFLISLTGAANHWLRNEPTVEYGVSSSLPNTAYSSQQINTAYPLPLDTAYRLSGTETKIIDFRAKFFLPSFGTNPTDCLKHFKSLSLDKLRSLDFNLLSDKEYSEEEEEKAMDKELRENTFSGSDNKDANEHIEKVLEIVDLFHVPNITMDQLMLLVFPFLNKYYPPGRTAKKMEEINNFQQELDETLYQAWEHFKELLMKGAVPTKTATDAKTAIQEMAEYSQKWHNGTSRGSSTETSDGLAAIQEQLNNLGREIKKVNEKVYAAQDGCEQCK
ncbi:hypothetical protein Tco_0589264 [Tanacetum coccineum]